MTDQHLQPHKVTKPIQLLAAWLVGLVLIDGTFLSAAGVIDKPEWATGLLVVAAVANVPIFLACLFLLQTRYRPEIQEDVYYSKYLETKTGTLISNQEKIVGDAVRTQVHEVQSVSMHAVEAVMKQIASIKRQLDLIASGIVQPETKQKLDQLSSDLDASESEIRLAHEVSRWAGLSVEVNDLLPEYGTIRQSLADKRIPVSGTFGSDSARPETPRKRILSFGSGVDIDTLRELLAILRPMGFDALDYDDDYMHNSRIYIGSYIYQYDSGHRAPIDDEISGALSDSSTTTSEFCALIESRYGPNKSSDSDKQ